MNEQTLQALANDDALCAQIMAKSTTLQKVASDHALTVLRQHIDGNLSFDGREVEVEVDPKTLSALFGIVAGQWRLMGETKPHWSVLSADEWAPDKLNDQNLRAFYETGRAEVEQFLHICRRNGLVPPKAARALEIGCGVGRVTAHLARHFDHVTGVDISPGNLRECAQALKQMALPHVELVQLHTPQALAQLRGYDLFFSRIVLQHNPPPIQDFMLRQVLHGLRSGGIAYFQTVTGGSGYRYSARQHIAQHKQLDFEMHALPMGRVLQAIEDAGCRLVDVFRDLAGGYNIDSYTFLAVRR